jgi:hypothetical protein
MSIVFKNSQLTQETIDALNKLIDVDINANVAFKLMRIIKEISSIIEDKNKMEQIIINKYAEKDENGNTIQTKDENGNIIEGGVKINDMDSFSKEMSNLMEIENEIEYDRINFEDLNLKTAKVKDLIRLDFLFN